MSEKLYVTRRGLEKMHAEIRKLEQDLQNLDSQVAEVAEVGGNQWHDNASYDSLVIDIRGADWRLKEAHRALAQATLVELPTSFDEVCIGAKITVRQNGSEWSFEVVGYGESDPENDLIMYKAPIVAMIWGKKRGDVATGTIGGKNVQIEILDISKGAG